MHLVDATLFYSQTSGGVRRYLNAKHDWLQRHTVWEHTLVVPGETDRLERGGICTLSGFAIPFTFSYRLPLDPRRWMRVIAALEPSIIEVGDAFHPAWCARSVADRLGIPAVAFYHSNLPQIIGRRAGRISERLLRRYLRALYSGFDRVLAPSRLMCEYLNDLGVSHTVHQPHGVDAEIFHPSRRHERLRSLLGLPGETRLLVYAGRFAGEKNLPVLYEAVERLGSPYHLLLIGGDERARPRPQVSILPYVRSGAELASLIASADALVHAGTEETFGLVLLEAMACGRPVVAPRASAIPEFVDESVGLLAEPLDPASMAEAIAALYERDLDALGRSARERVLRQYTWSRSFQAQTHLYATLAGAYRLAAATHAELPSSP